MGKENNKTYNIVTALLQGIKPLCVYYLVNQAVVILGSSLMTMFFPQLGTEGLGEVYIRTVIQMAAMFLAALSVFPYYKRENEFLEKNSLSVKNVGVIVMLGVVFSLVLNFLFSAAGFLQSSESYSQVAQRQFSLPFWLAFLFYGILSPWAEEVVFRGIFYRVLKRNMTEVVAVLGSALMFGAFHGNMVQMLYGSIMGVVMALLYGRFSNLLAPILFHGAANTAIYVITYFF